MSLPEGPSQGEPRVPGTVIAWEIARSRLAAAIVSATCGRPEDMRVAVRDFVECASAAVREEIAASEGRLAERVAGLAKRLVALEEALRAACDDRIALTGRVAGLEAGQPEAVRYAKALHDHGRLPSGGCGRCGHPASWHRLDDASDQDPTDPKALFRCLGYDCDADGPVPPGGRACGCPAFVATAVTPTPESAVPVGRGEEPAVFAYLYGSGKLEGRWFGDGPPEGKGPYWWREALEEARGRYREALERVKRADIAFFGMAERAAGLKDERDEAIQSAAHWRDRVEAADAERDRMAADNGSLRDQLASARADLERLTGGERYQGWVTPMGLGHLMRRDSLGFTVWPSPVTQNGEPGSAVTVILHRPAASPAPSEEPACPSEQDGGSVPTEPENGEPTTEGRAVARAVPDGGAPEVPAEGERVEHTETCPECGFRWLWVEDEESEGTHPCPVCEIDVAMAALDEAGVGHARDAAEGIGMLAARNAQKADLIRGIYATLDAVGAPEPVESPEHRIRALAAPSGLVALSTGDTVSIARLVQMWETQRANFQSHLEAAGGMGNCFSLTDRIRKLREAAEAPENPRDPRTPNTLPEAQLASPEGSNPRTPREAFQITPESRASNADWPDWMHEAWHKDIGDLGSLYPKGIYLAKGSDGRDPLCLTTRHGVIDVPWGSYLVQGESGEVWLHEDPEGPSSKRVAGERAPASAAASTVAPSEPVPQTEPGEGSERDLDDAAWLDHKLRWRMWEIPRPADRARLEGIVGRLRAAPPSSPSQQEVSEEEVEMVVEAFGQFWGKWSAIRPDLRTPARDLLRRLRALRSSSEPRAAGWCAVTIKLDDTRTRDVTVEELAERYERQRVALATVYAEIAARSAPQPQQAEPYGWTVEAPPTKGSNLRLTRHESEADLRTHEQRNPGLPYRVIPLFREPPAPGRTEALAALDDAITAVASARKGSIGSTNNTYLPQIGVERVERWKRARDVAKLTPSAPSGEGDLAPLSEQHLRSALLPIVGDAVKSRPIDSDMGKVAQGFATAITDLLRRDFGGRVIPRWNERAPSRPSGEGER